MPQIEGGRSKGGGGRGGGGSCTVGLLFHTVYCLVIRVGADT